MQIETKFHGELAIQPDQIWHFPKGLPGFEEEHAFVLLPIEGNAYFQVLQSTENALIAFIVGNPYSLVEDYAVKIDEPTMALLDIEQEEDVMILNVLTVKDSFEKSTINLQAPLVFQVKDRRAKQMILNDSTYSMRHPIQPSRREEG